MWRGNVKNLPPMGASLGNVGLWASLRGRVPGAHEKAKRGARPRRIKRARPGRGKSCSPETAQGRVGRRVPTPSPGVRAAGTVGTPVCDHAARARCGHLASILREHHLTSFHATPPRPSSDPFPYPHLSACPSHTGFGAQGPAGIPLAVAVAAQPGPGAPKRRKKS